MGIRGLTGLFRDKETKAKYKNQWIPMDCDVVIVDGHAFSLHLYFLHCTDWMYGADFATYVKELETFLEQLKQDGIKASFVFDGDTPTEKVETKTLREKVKVEVAQRMLEPTRVLVVDDPRPDDKGPAPVLLIPFTKYVMQRMKVDFVTADVEADAPLVAKAAALNAFVVSNDSDHMIMDGHRGFIHMEDFVTRVDRKDQVGRFPVLTAAAVAQVLGLPTKRLPWLAGLKGNDYVLQDRLQDFHEHLFELYKHRKEERSLKRDWALIELIATWLDTKSPESSIEKLWQNHLGKRACPVRDELWEYSLSHYNHRGTEKEIGMDGLASSWERRLRVSPSAPRQFAGLLRSQAHFCPALMEVLRPVAREGPGSVQSRSSSWGQSLEIRAAAIKALGFDRFQEWVGALHSVGADEARGQQDAWKVEIVKRTVRVADFNRLKDSPPAEEDGAAAQTFLAVMRCPGLGPHNAAWTEVFSEGTCVQVATLHYWVASHNDHWGSVPHWLDLAGFLLTFMLSPEERAAVVKHVSPGRPDLRATQALASFDGCLLSAMELSTAHEDPFGNIDFDRLSDGPFFCAIAGLAELDVGDILRPALKKQAPLGQARFEKALRLLLEALKGHAPQKLRGQAQRRGGDSLIFRAEVAPQTAPTAPSTATPQDPQGSEQEKERKKLEKKLKQIDQIEDLLASGKELNEDQKQKVSEKEALKLRLAQLSEGVGRGDVLELWGILS